MNSVNKADLYRLYITERKTMKQISQELGIAVGKIHRLIHEYGIPVRKIGDYPATDKQRPTWVRIGKNGKGRKMTDAQRKNFPKQKRYTVKGIERNARTDI